MYIRIIITFMVKASLEGAPEPNVVQRVGASLQQQVAVSPVWNTGRWRAYATNLVKIEMGKSLGNFC